MEWHGNEAYLVQLCEMFKAASSPDSTVQQQVMHHLNTFSALPDFDMYLVCIFASMPQQDEVVRQRAGLLLKTNVQRSQCNAMDKGIAAHILANTLTAMQDANRTIRHTAGSILTAMVQKQGLQTCGPTLERLVESLANQSSEVVEGSLSALTKTCEDGVLLMSADDANAERNNLFALWCEKQVLPRVFQCAQPASPAFMRQGALECLNHFALNGVFTDEKRPSLHQFATQYINTLGCLANDTVVEVMQAVCKGFAYVMEQNWTVLTEQHYEVILRYMLKASQNPEYSVRWEALAVWSTCAGNWHTWDAITPMLPELVPTLLANMVYSNADYMSMDPSQLADDNADNPDSLDEIAPRFHKDSAKGGSGDAEADEDEEGAKSTGGAWGAEWTARKSAALALDNLAQVFTSAVLDQVLPLMEQKLQHSDWEQQESAVLALGAIAAGGMSRLVQFLPQIMGLLLGLCTAPKPLLRSISVWCVSRFSSWICHEQNANRQQVLGSVLQAILKLCLDRNKRVQEAACSALAVMQESALTLLGPHLDSIIETLVTAFRLYQAKNLRILYDAVGTLSWAAGAELDKPKYLQALMTPLMVRFASVPDNDPSAIAMFECLGYISMYLGKSIIEVIPKLIERCMRIVEEIGKADELWEQNPNEFARPEHDLLAAAVDLLSGIYQGLGAQGAKEACARTNFLMALPVVLRCSAPRVKQAGFGMMGTCAGAAIEPLMPFLPQLLPMCVAGLGPAMPANVINNASWSIGEVCINTNAEFMSPYLSSIVPAVVAVLKRQQDKGLQPWVLRRLQVGACYTIGRLGYVCGQHMGAYLPHFLAEWCWTLRGVPPDREKIMSLQALVSMIRANPEAGMDCFGAVATVVCSIGPTAPPVLAAPCQEVLLRYKQAFGERWPTLHSQLPADLQGRLASMYNITAQ